MKMKKLQAADVAFLDLERPATPPLMGALIIMDPSTAPGSFVRHRDILQYLEARLHLAPNLRKRLIDSPLKLDEPRLVDDPDFDLEFHVRHLGLPRPRDRRQLNILTARLMSRPMDMNRPLWEIYIIEGLDEIPEYPSEAFAVLIKLHHAAFDGVAGSAAIWSMMQTTPDAQPEPPKAPWTPEPKPKMADWAVSMLLEAGQQTIKNAQALPSLWEGALRGGLATVTDDFSLTAPKTRFQGRISSHRVLDWVIFPNAEFRAIRAALGKPKMNDLVLCVIAGGVRRYLSSKGELPEPSLLALCPINVRGAGDPTEGGNHVSAMRVSIGSDIEDPLERLKHIAASSLQGKDQAEKLGGTFLGDLMALSPYPIRSTLMRGANAIAAMGKSPVQLANLVVSNIPNPRGEYYFAGSKFFEYAAFGPITPGIGLFHTVTGMDWEMSFSVASCREILPDIAFYMDCLRESYEEVRALAKQVDGDGTVPPPAVAPPSRRRKKARLAASPQTREEQDGNV